MTTSSATCERLILGMTSQTGDYVWFLSEFMFPADMEGPVGLYCGGRDSVGRDRPVYPGDCGHQPCTWSGMLIQNIILLHFQWWLQADVLCAVYMFSLIELFQQQKSDIEFNAVLATLGASTWYVRLSSYLKYIGLSDTCMIQVHHISTLYDPVPDLWHYPVSMLSISRGLIRWPISVVCCTRVTFPWITWRWRNRIPRRGLSVTPRGYARSSSNW